jgi:hypothetical protein
MSERIYGWLLKLYPARFREEYAASMLQLFRDRLQAEQGGFRRLRFLLDMMIDLSSSIPVEHRRQNALAPALGWLRLSEEAVTSMTKRRAVDPAVCVCVFVSVGFTAGRLGNSERVLLSFLVALVVSPVIRTLLATLRQRRHRE